MIQTITVDAVEIFGGGALGWRTVAIIYSLIGLIVNTISVFSVKELQEDTPQKTSIETMESKEKEETYTLVDTIKLLLANKFYIIISHLPLIFH